MAALEGHIEVVKFLVEKGAGVNARDIDGNTALHWMAIYGNTEVVKLLVANGAGVNARDMDEYTALHCAASEGHIEIVKFLVANGAGVNSRDIDGYTVLHWASWYGNTEVVKFLVGKGIGVNTRGKDGNTVLHCAVLGDHVEIIKFLIENGADVNIASYGSRITPLYDAAGCGRVDVVNALLEAGAEINARDENGQTALYRAAARGRVDAVETLLKWDANFLLKDNDGRAPIDLIMNSEITQLLKEAKEKIQKKIIGESGISLGEFLLANGDKLIHYMHNSKLLAALDQCKKDHPTFAKMIDTQCEAGGKAIAERRRLAKEASNAIIRMCKLGKQALHDDEISSIEIIAANLPNIELKELIIEDINIKDENGQTLLHLAAENGRMEEVEELVKKGASIHIVDKDRNSALHFAAVNGYVGIVKYLLNEGAKVNAANHYGETALHWASRYGRLDIVNELLAIKDIEVNAKDAMERTPLHRAVSGGYIGIVKVLLEQGANADAISKNRMTALHKAINSGNKDMVKFLLTASAKKPNTQVSNTQIAQAGTSKSM